MPQFPHLHLLRHQCEDSRKLCCQAENQIQGLNKHLCVHIHGCPSQQHRGENNLVSLTQSWIKRLYTDHREIPSHKTDCNADLDYGEGGGWRALKTSRLREEGTAST